MPELVGENAEFSCPHCTCKLKLKVLMSPAKGEGKKLANLTNCLIPPPPGGMCSFPPGVPPSPCPGIPPGMVMSTGQSKVNVKKQTALGNGCKFMCPKAQMASLSNSGQKKTKHDEAQGDESSLSAFEIIEIIAAIGMLILSRGKNKNAKALARAGAVAKKVVQKVGGAAKSMMKKSPGGAKAPPAKQGSPSSATPKTSAQSKPPASSHGESSSGTPGKQSNSKSADSKASKSSTEQPKQSSTEQPKQSTEQSKQTTSPKSSSSPPTAPQPPSNVPNKPLPRDQHGNPVPDQSGAHYQWGTKKSSKGKKEEYIQAREWGADGKPVRDIHYTDHSLPNHANPHQHRYIPNPSGGTPQHGPAEPVNIMRLE